MTINTLNLRKYKSLLLSAIDPGSQIAESVCIDLKNRRVHLVTGIIDIHFNLPVEGDITQEEQDLPFIFFNARRFYALVDAYVRLELRTDGILYGPDGHFDLQPLMEDFRFQSFDNFKVTHRLTLGFDPEKPQELTTSLKQATSFASTDLSAQAGYVGLFLLNDRIVSSNRKVMYEHVLSTPPNQTLSISLAQWNLLCSLPLTEAVLEYNATHVRVISDVDDFSLYFGMNTQLSPPPIFEPDFIRTAYAGDRVLVNKNVLRDMFKFLEPFAAMAPNHRIIWTFEEQDLGEGPVPCLGLAVIDGMTVKRYVPLLSPIIPTMTGGQFSIDLSVISKVLGIFNDETVELETNLTDDSGCVNIVSPGNPGHHVAVGKLNDA